MKRLLLLGAVLAMCMTGAAWGDVVVLNSMGEPDSNRPGEDMPEWIMGGDGSVNTSDTAGAESTACLQWDQTATSGDREIFNDHYEDPIDASCCFGYFNFYIKVAEGSLTEMGVWGTTTDWDGWFGWEYFDISGAAGEWLYVSLDMSDFDETGGDELDDLSNLETIGLAFYDPTDAVILTDHWTMSTTSEEGMLTAPAPEAEVSISGPHVLEVGETLVLEATAEGFDEGTESYQWSKNGGELGGETAATLNVGVVDGADEGTYSVAVEGDIEGEPASAEASFLVMVYEVGEAPVAGGLGLGLMAGACALAGAVSIRRRK